MHIFQIQQTIVESVVYILGNFSLKVFKSGKFSLEMAVVTAGWMG